jgi:beta-phosphoglucomutase-like phosphatase (HAD superfamily)
MMSRETPMHPVGTLPVSGIVLDCDGTLIDSMPMWQLYERQLARRAGVTVTGELADRLNANTLIETVRLFHEVYGVGESDKVLLDESVDFLRAGYHCVCPLKPGAAEFVDEAARRNVRMGVVSSTPRELLIDALEHAGILSQMVAVISAGDLGSTKREAEPIRTMHRLLGTSISQTWCFDDSVYALDVYVREGYHAVGVYDTDIAGTYEALAEASEAVVKDFTSFDIAAFFDGGGIRPLAFA